MAEKEISEIKEVTSKKEFSLLPKSVIMRVLDLPNVRKLNGKEKIKE